MIRRRLISEYFDSKILENNLRGYWCEAMVAAALGKTCKITSGGWAPWDLQIGEDTENFPDRIRMQVKSAARLQTWHSPGAEASDPIFSLKYRNRPSYWARDFPSRSCETSGFLCDIFVLCFHDNSDRSTADQRDPAQWKVYLLSAHPEDGDITRDEFAERERTLNRTGRQSALQRRPQTMTEGIRGRRPTLALPLGELTSGAIYQTLYKSRQLIG